MNKAVIIVHGFCTKQEDKQIINLVNYLGFHCIYYDWFRWQKVFDSSIFVNRFSRDLHKYDVVSVIGISLGGLIVGEYLEKIKNTSILLIASCPKFDPVSISKLVSKLPESIIKIGIKVHNLLYETVIKGLFNRKKFILTLSLFKKLSTEYILSLRRYLNKTDNTLSIKDNIARITVLSGEKDMVMPLRNWDKFNCKKYLSKNSTHYNVVNKDSLKLIKNYLISVST